MTRSGDAGSCSALAAELRSGARRLRSCSDAEDITTLARDLDGVAEALVSFAEGLRDPAPLRRGRPFPQTALRNALAALDLR